MINALNTEAFQYMLNYKYTRIAAIMDEFSFSAFSSVAEVVQLVPNAYEQQIIDFRPEFVFIESAWHGHKNLWHGKLFNTLNLKPHKNIINLLIFCKTNAIPTIFWNKEDPVYFTKFLPVAKLVDWVFTTDATSIPQYQMQLKHNRVFLLPFAANPNIHNPIELYPRKDAISFAGGYYFLHKQRKKDFASIILQVKKFRDVVIYDRFHTLKNNFLTKFPGKYHSMIVGELSYENISQSYKGYCYALNVNTVTKSKTMFSRRVFELIASNTVVISNYSIGINNFFGELIIQDNNTQLFTNKLNNLFSSSELYRRKIKLLALRKVMQEHTYTHRLEYILSKIFNINSEIKNKCILIIAVAHNKAHLDNLIYQFKKQIYRHKLLYILSDFSTLQTTEKIVIFNSKEKLIKAIFATPEINLIGFFSNDDYYSVNYLTDLIIAHTYAIKAVGFGKASYYIYEQSNCKIYNDNHQYRYVTQLLLRNSIIRIDYVNETNLNFWLNDINNSKICQQNLFSVDEFNYCFNGQHGQNSLDIINDLNKINTGSSMDKIISLAHHKSE